MIHDLDPLELERAARHAVLIWTHGRLSRGMLILRGNGPLKVLPRHVVLARRRYLQRHELVR